MLNKKYILLFVLFFLIFSTHCLFYGFFNFKPQPLSQDIYSYDFDYQKDRGFDTSYDIDSWIIKNTNPLLFPLGIDDLQLVSISNRPDHLLENIHYLLMIKGIDQLFVVDVGSTVYFLYQDDQLVVSKKPTALSIELVSDDDFLTFRCNSPLTYHQDSQIFINHELVLSKCDVDQSNNGKPLNYKYQTSEYQSAVDSLKNSKFLSSDCLFKKYGGLEYKEFSKCYRLENSDRNILFLKQGDIFYFKNNCWIEGYDPYLPIAKVVSISPFQVTVTSWDSKGLSSDSVDFIEESDDVASESLENLFHSLKQKNEVSVFGYINNLLINYSIGDWLFFENDQWRALQSIEDLDSIIEYQNRGVLFIFDSIKKIHGQYYACGHLFNKTRSKISGISVALSQSFINKNNHKAHNITSLKNKYLDEK